MPSKKPAEPKPRSQKPTAEPETLKKQAPWMYGVPWEQYEGVRSPVIGEGGAIVSIIEQGGGKLKVIEPALNEDSAESFEFGGGPGTKTIFSQSAVDDVLLDDDTKVRAMEMSYKFDREDPMYHGIIQGYKNFIIGKGIKFKARDENPEVQKYLDRFWKENAMDGRDANWILRFLRTGELALRWYEKDSAGRLALVPKVRAVPFWRISKIIRDENDDAKTISYELSSTGIGSAGVNRSTAPSANPEAGVATTATQTGKPVPVLASEMMFWHNGDEEEVRGSPPFLPVMRAVKWYSDWLLNRVIFNRFRTAHVLFKKLKATPAQVGRIRAAVPDATSHQGLNGKFEKRMPKMGTMVTHNENVEYEWKSPELGAGDAQEDGRAIRTYIGAGAQVPEFLLGDSSQANYSSSLVAENPFVRQVEFWQDFFTGVFGAMFERVIKHGIEAGEIPKTSWETSVGESGAVMRTFRRMLSALHVSESVLPIKSKKTEIPTKTEVDIGWPTLIHADQLEEAQTLQAHQAMGAVSLETIRQKLNYDHVVEKRRIAIEKEEDDQYASDRDGEIAADKMSGSPADGDDDAAAADGGI